MISGRAAVVSIFVHAAVAGWVANARPAREAIVEDAEGAPAIEVIFEFEPTVVPEVATASVADIAMATDRPMAVEQVLPETAPEPESASKPVEPAPLGPEASDIELPPLPELPSIETADITPSLNNAPPPPPVPARPEVVAAASPLVIATDQAETLLPKNPLPETKAPVVEDIKPAVRKLEPKRKVAQKAPVAKKKLATKPIAKRKRVGGPAPVAKLAGGKKKSVSSKKALAAATGKKIIASGGSAIDPSYKSRILAKLRSAKRAPKAGVAGRVVLAFTVSRSGGLLSARIVKSGGHPALDQATLSMARAASPFPVMPPSMNRASMSFTVPVQYN